MEEIWKTIECYENYQVSNLGNVKSLQYGKTRILKQESVKGYLRVSLSKDNKVKRFQVHRLVALNFIQNIKNKNCVNHINGDKKDNLISNLEWVTYAENEKHSYDILGKVALRGEQKTQSKLTEKQVLEIRAIKGMLRKDIALIYKVSTSLIDNIINRKRWNHI